MEVMQAYSRSIVATARSALLILDANLRIVAANERFYHTFGVRPGIEGCAFFEIDGGRWNHPRVRTLLEAVIPQDCSFTDLEFECDSPDVGRRVMTLNARRVVRDDNTPMALLVFKETGRQVQSITPLTGVAHDFNNLLTIITGYSSMLLDRLPVDDPSREMIAEIYHAGQRSGGLVRNLVMPNRQTSGPS
jgi:signal transduction histidine kinase